MVLPISTQLFNRKESVLRQELQKQRIKLERLNSQEISWSGEVFVAVVFLESWTNIIDLNQNCLAVFVLSIVQDQEQNQLVSPSKGS